jgi:hypothetical protein
MQGNDISCNGGTSTGVAVCMVASGTSNFFRQETPPGSRLDRTYLIKELDGTCVMAHQREAPVLPKSMYCLSFFRPRALLCQCTIGIF